MAKAFASQADLEESAVAAPRSIHPEDRRRPFRRRQAGVDPEIWAAERDREMWEALEG